MDKAERYDLKSLQIDHPAIKAGEHLDLWLTDVNIDRSWGVFLHNPAGDATRSTITRRYAETTNGRDRSKSIQNVFPFKSFLRY